MTRNSYHFEYEVYLSADALEPGDAALLAKAREATVLAYAPYSNFFVGAAAKMGNGAIVFGANQENAAFPAGLCAERVVLGNISSAFPNEPIDTMAISYDSKLVNTDHPISPCGICRQSLQEYEQRIQLPIRLILSGMSGKVLIIPRASMLLPLSFSKSDLNIR
ncbi:cytidine deaminase [Flavihumibacter fluvii]|uniref:cytidine deaminase n=1 Tax=Flavihumibacter fluvii TaxID=2838157 RepID=UPI001BDF5250|nr:cytidine deaminase [Flavihumibacter fluvii]ULQ53879.1 cytidine deaminase [Flavihumibacter fluvii]